MGKDLAERFRTLVCRKKKKENGINIEVTGGTRKNGLHC